MEKKEKSVIITDDEYLVRMGCQDMINHEINGFTVVGAASNEQETLQLFAECQPDLFICDIRLGGSNGLDIVKKIRSFNQKVKIIILTHYDDFDFARTAFRYGIDEYILKSDLTPAALQETLRWMFPENEAALGSAEPESSAPDDLSTPLSEDMETEINGFGDQQLGDDIQIAIAIMKMYFGFEQEMQPNLSKQEYGAVVTSIFTDILRDKHITFSIRYSKAWLNILFRVFKDADPDESLRTIALAMNALQKTVLRIMSVESIVGISTICKGSTSTLALQAEALAAYENAYFDPAGISTYDAFLSSGRQPRRRYSGKGLALNTLLKYIKRQDADGLRAYFFPIAEEIISNCRIRDMQHFFNDMVSYLKLIAHEYSGAENVILEARFSYDVFYYLCGHAAVQQYIQDLLHEIMRLYTDAGATDYSYVVRKCINYINQNYNTNLTLTDIAEYLQISKSYISMLFKQEVGQTMTNYITSFRIEQAKQLMRETNDKMYEIAMKTGFDNPYYFSKVFKEITGMTCKEYRNSVDAFGGEE